MAIKTEVFISRVLQSLQIPAIRLCYHPLRAVDPVHLQILLMVTCRQCDSWSDADHNHRKVIGRDPICAGLHDMGPDLLGSGSTETMYEKGDRNLAVA